MWMMKSSCSPAKGIVAGLVGGLFASWVMNQFQAGVKRIASSAQNEDKGGWAASQSGGEGYAQEAGEEEEAATVQTAAAISEGVFQHELEPEEKQSAGQIVHYAYGAAIGGLYGWAAERSSIVRTGFGTLFGAALWFAGDEIGVPMFGLAKEPQEYPISTHASALGAHLVYGATTEFVRGALRHGYLSS